MATTYTSAVQQLYVAYFNRPADPAGLDFWAKAIASANGSTAAVAAAFSTAVEYTEAYKGMTNAQIVDQVYQNLFGRSTGSDKGAQFWIDGLDKKTITVADVVVAVAAGAQGTDLTAFNNKVIAATQFTASLDTDAEIAGYAGTDANAIAREFLAGVTTNATLAAAIEPANLNQVVADAVAAGTEFTVVGALKNLEAATDAKDAYLESITDEDATATITETEVAKALTDATDDFMTEFNAQNATAAVAYSNATSATIKAALIDDQVAHNVEVLAADQKKLANVNAQIAEVPKLATAISNLDSAKDAQEDAVKAAGTAATNLTAQTASFKVTAATAIAANGGSTVDINATTDAVLLNNADDTKDVQLIVNKDGVLSLGTDVTEKAYPGITALLNSLTADLAAKAGVNNANAVVNAAQGTVDKLDVDSTEAAALVTLKSTGGFTATGTPTTAQIVEKDAALKALADAETDPAGTAHTNYTNYHNAVGAYNAAVALNPLYTAHTAAAGAVEADAKHISDFNEALAALNTAQKHVDDLAGYNVTIEAASNLFEANDYHLVNLAASANTATASSDVYVVDSASPANTTITLFGLQGSDSIYVGEGYKLVNGKISTSAVSSNPGSDSALEVFVSQSGANTVVSIEQSAFGSHTATPEVVSITLVGVTSTDVHLDANGLITVGTAA